jgi:DNA-binding transcriptional regulator YiaG
MPPTPTHDQHDHDEDPAEHRDRACRSRPRLGRTPPTETEPGRAVFSPARLRAWRHVTGTTHTTLADAAHTTTEHVQACERGTTQPHPDTLATWARVLGCQPDQLRSTDPDAPTEYWNAASHAMPPMSSADLAVIAEVIMRSRAHRTPPH